MEDPVRPEEREALIQDFLKKINSSGERRAFLSSLEGLIQADGITTSEEEEFLKEFKQILQDTPSVKGLFNQFQGLFKKTVFKPVPGSKRSEELHEFINNRILFKVRRKLERENLSLETHPEDLAFASLFGGLMAYVASVHENLNSRELAKIQTHLKNLGTFGDEAIELILSVIQETHSKLLDSFRLVREFYEMSSPQQRRQLIDCLFDIAGSDKDLKHEEVEEVRNIAYALKLTHKEFIESKVAYLQKGKPLNKT
jgi:uncharacterized tellurite resistance protein B-like protein